jgi:hypothetical protein
VAKIVEAHDPRVPGGGDKVPNLAWNASQRAGDLGAARPDFLDRTLIVEFSELRPEMRRDEAQFWREFDGARGRILGALLDTAVVGLRNLPEVRIDHPPRMADFAIWASACENALGARTGGFLQTYQDNRADGRVLTPRVLAAL